MKKKKVELLKSSWTVCQEVKTFNANTSQDLLAPLRGHHLQQQQKQQQQQQQQKQQQQQQQQQKQQLK